MLGWMGGERGGEVGRVGRAGHYVGWLGLGQGLLRICPIAFQNDR